MITAELAMAALWDKPLEVVERTGDETLAAAVSVAASAVERDEVPARDAILVAFAAGTYFASVNLPAVTDEMVERAAMRMETLIQDPVREAGLPPIAVPMIEAENRSIVREILEAALRPAADPPTADDGAD